MSEAEPIKAIRALLKLNAETDVARAVSEICAAFDEECRLRTVAEANLESFTADVAVRVGLSNMLRSPAGLLRKLDEMLSGGKVNDGLCCKSRS